ncbi:MAG: methyltransferase [Terriglobales bacterium]|jgi:(2Fe-2S) ferredoxin/ubiquinone/menaquinone biosynthesis C-methylase UbiE
MEPFRHHIFVCTQEKPEGVACCPASGAWGLLGALDRELRSQGLDDEVQVSTCGCLGLCDDGPIMIVYPEGVWYRKLKAEDVAEIVTSHLRSGNVVARLAWTDAPAMKAASKEHRDRYGAMVKAKDEAGTLPDDLDQTIRAYMPSRTLLTALELDIFTAVGTGGSAGQVAQKIRADARATEMLLNALVSLKLLQKKDGIFLNSAATMRFFSAGSPNNARDGLLHTANIWHRWSTLTECVRAGTSVATEGRDHGWVKNFIVSMNRNATERADAVIKAAAPGPIRRMLDLGGGSGAYSIAFARAIPTLESEVLDLAEVVPLTQEYIRNAGLSDRIQARAGDMLRDPLGSNYDLVLISAICHMFSPEENRDLFRRAYQALAPKGQIVVQDFILEPAKTAPRFAALFALNMLVGTRAGSSYSEPEYETWLRKSGFSAVRRVRLPGPSGLMIAARD